MLKRRIEKLEEKIQGKRQLLLAYFDNEGKYYHKDEIYPDKDSLDEALEKMYGKNHLCIIMRNRI